MVSHALYGDTNYQSGESCEWVIVAPDNYQVEFSFEHIEVEWEEACKYDRVRFYEGELMEASSHKITICGEKVPERSIVSTRESLLVVFETDDTLNKKGFLASFRAIQAEFIDTRYGEPEGPRTLKLEEPIYISFT